MICYGLFSAIENIFLVVQLASININFFFLFPDNELFIFLSVLQFSFYPG